MIISNPLGATVAGRIAVVTGANKGIGYFIALQLATSGLFEHIILACRDVQRGTQAVELMKSDLVKQNPSSTVQITTNQLIVGDTTSHEKFVQYMEEKYGKVDCLINNAGFAYKNADPTPFQEQTKPTLDINFRGPVDFTERMLPLIRKGSDPRIVNVASMSGRLSQLSPTLQSKFTSPTLTIPELKQLVNDFEQSVQSGTFKEKGWGRSNYGLSKLALIAATNVLARENPKIAINSCCPGFCKTDMTSQGGYRPPYDGAKNAVLPATMQQPPTGAYFSDYNVANW